MKKTVFFTVVLLGLTFGTEAFAHVGYRNLNALNPFTASVTADHGWAEGANGSTWGDSHHIRWFSFNLVQDSLVSINVADTGAGTFTNYNGSGAAAGTFTSVGNIDVGFSLYRNLLPTSAFEGATNAAYVTDTNPLGYVYSTEEHAPIGSTGLFNALGDVTMGNNSGVIGTINYVTHKNDLGVGGTESLVNLFLPAGTYSLAVGGATAGGTNAGTFGVIASLSVQAVPVPAAVWLFGSALAGMGIVGRRRQAAA